MSSEEFILADLKEQYRTKSIDEAFMRLYDRSDDLSPMFAHHHKRLNDLLSFLNSKNRQNGHYNADESRELIALIDNIEEVKKVLSTVGIEVSIDERYRDAIESCKKFLSESGGSTIPDTFYPVELVRYYAIFSRDDKTIRQKSADRKYNIKMIGEGAFALVYKYYDEDYDMEVALKRAKKGLTDKEIERFRAEFEMLKKIKFPYILKAYVYDDARNEYTMEYCDTTLGEYIKKNNANLGSATRKRVALQFLYGVNHLHRHNILHRDISRGNILIQKFDPPAVAVKLSDFGLHKKVDSEFTATESSMKGTLVDPTLDRFKEFDTLAEVYAIGHILSYIFTGRENIGASTGVEQKIVERCTSMRRNDRYGSVSQIIRDVEGLP